jgi:hypothetical protein
VTERTSSRAIVDIFLYFSPSFCRCPYHLAHDTVHSLQAVTQDEYELVSQSQSFPLSQPLFLSFPALVVHSLGTLMYISPPSYSSRRASTPTHRSHQFHSSFSSLSLACLSGGTAVHTISADNIFSPIVFLLPLPSFNWTTLSHSQHLAYLHRLKILLHRVPGRRVFY